MRWQSVRDLGINLFKKRSRSRTLWIGGSTSIIGMIAYILLLTGISETHSGDIYCDTVCESYVNITTTYWRICFESDINFVSTNPNVNTELYVPTYGKKWRPFVPGKDCIERGKINKFKIVGYKESSETVKWSFMFNKFGGVDIDPTWYGNSTFNVSVYCKNCLAGDGDDTSPFTTFNRTPLFNLSTNQSASCYISGTNSSYELCEDTVGLFHNCTLPTADILDPGSNYVYLNCSNVIGRLQVDVNISTLSYEIDMCSDISTIYFQLGPNNFTGYNISADGQLNDNCTFNLTNTDSVNGTLKIYVDETEENHTLWANDKCETTGSVNITTSKKTINSSLPPNNSTIVCFWMDIYGNSSYEPDIYVDLWDYDDKVK